ncbi:DUF262 domain-containing protein [Microbispora sp. NPDC049125]|uniref:DUF262 domain-containing protein n=1 Tax=Microbispora sp. NPDC049125 TaxID=3154929 RepID=UPI00346636C3
MTTHQTLDPIEYLSLHVTMRSPRDMVRIWEDGDLAWDGPAVPYQRGPAWTRDQQIQLIASSLSGIPIPAIITNRRNWKTPGPVYVVIDGQQRLRTFAAWFKGNLPVPATWWKDGMYEQAFSTVDGPYVTYADLTVLGQRYFNNHASLAVAEGSLPTVQAEAEVYLRVNGYGTVQTDADLDRAARVARGE